MAKLYSHLQETAEGLRRLGAGDLPALLILWDTPAEGLLEGLRPLGGQGDLPHCPARGRLLVSGPWLVLEDAPSRHDGYGPSALAQLPRAFRLAGGRLLAMAGPVCVLDAKREGEPLFLLSDHLNLTGDSPLVGPHEEALGERFPDMRKVWSPRLRRLAVGACGAGEAVLAGLAGPDLETPAQLAFLAGLGADLADWRFVAESLAAAHAGLEAAGLAWPRDRGEGGPSPTTTEALRAALKALAADLEHGEGS